MTVDTLVSASGSVVCVGHPPDSEIVSPCSKIRDYWVTYRALPNRVRLRRLEHTIVEPWKAHLVGP